MPIEGVFHNLATVQIKKEYAGQGQKVMNAMWGAGQMMFNKILVLADEGTSISDYEKLAKYVFANLNPATDIYFSQGPMDVLDHSCSKLGFGGKMCIDGTKKFDEEIDEHFALAINDHQFVNNDLATDLKNRFHEIHETNNSLLKKEIPCVIISVKKNRPGHIKELHQKICETTAGITTIKMILYVEHTVDPNDLTTALWRFCNNLDPKRDYSLYQQKNKQDQSETFACIGFDGTRKTKEIDDFQRDWPNIIVANDETIRLVDEKWNKLQVGEFIPSPSLKFKDQLYGEEAIVN
jgi:4-hydroxy-3-polyprenylbenzoate decarboxylase